MELDIVKLLEDRDDYYKYIGLIVKERMSDDILMILDNLGEFFDEHPGIKSVTWRTFYTWYTVTKHPMLPSAKVTILEEMCTQLEKMTAPMTSVLKNFVLRDYAAQLTDVSMDLLDGTGKHTLDDADELVLACRRDLDAVEGRIKDAHVCDVDLLDDLLAGSAGSGYEWRLNELQVAVGSIRQGDFLIVGARPDSGKTTFLASEATHFATQVPEDQCVLWFNNEEARHRVRGRHTQAALNWTKAEMDKDPKSTLEAYEKAIGGDLTRLRMIDKSDLSVTDIDRYCARFNPALIIIDQVWKIQGFESNSSNEIARYSKIAQYLRELAKRVGPVIVTSQIDDKAEGERYPDMSRLYNSKTAVQGEVDVIIMVGRDHDEPPTTRFIHTPKNKLTGGNNDFRNARWAVGLDQERARFKSKIAYRS